MKTLIKTMVALCAVLAAPQANALCDIGQARVIHAESTPFNNPVTNQMLYWVAPGLGVPGATIPPSNYYVFSTVNQTYINLLNAALASGKQVRVTGSAAACPAAGVLRAAGAVVAVFMDAFF